MLTDTLTCQINCSNPYRLQTMSQFNPSCFSIVIFGEMQHVAFSRIASVDLSVCVVCPSRIRHCGKLRGIKYPFFHHLIGHKKAIQ